LTEDQIKSILADMEADNIERTESTHDTEKFCIAICAFANDLAGHRNPGYLLIGVKDNGTLSGLNVTDDILKNMSSIRSDGNVR
jgi:ATP-dependent DNA helicase RecG